MSINQGLHRKWLLSPGTVLQNQVVILNKSKIIDFVLRQKMNWYETEVIFKKSKNIPSENALKKGLKQFFSKQKHFTPYFPSTTSATKLSSLYTKLKKKIEPFIDKLSTSNKKKITKDQLNALFQIFPFQENLPSLGSLNTLGFSETAIKIITFANDELHLFWELNKKVLQFNWTQWSKNLTLSVQNVLDVYEIKNEKLKNFYNVTIQVYCYLRQGNRNEIAFSENN
ncbi:MAG: hypothetical protein CL678_17500 [Bdellovibrionaceae bacterium]|nr:hypothetical protein [Pseudobdellovibrionaceae bacterium]